MRSMLASLLVLVCGLVAGGQPPDPKQAGKKQPRMHFDAEIGQQVPVISLPPEELVPTGKLMLLADSVDWGVLKLNAPEAHKTTKGKGVKVCVLDTGLDYTHPDFGGIPQERMKSFVPGQSIMDAQGHGTHCMGRVAARGMNYGMAPEAEIWAGKVLGNDGSGAVTWIARGIDWATDSGVDVVSMSLGGAGQDSYIPPALDRAEAAGILVVCAAGNEGPGEGTVGYPGGYAKAVAIGAVDKNLTIARFSSRGKQVFSAFPGVDIVSQYPGGRQAPMSGTSMATPHAAGEAALWIAAHPEIPKKDRPAKYREWLQKTAQDLGPAGRDTAYGWGFSTADKMVAGGTIVDPPPPPPGKGFTGEVTVTLTFKDGAIVGAKPATGGKVDPAALEKAKTDVAAAFNDQFGAGAKVIDLAKLIKLIQDIIDAIGRSSAKSTVQPIRDDGRWALSLSPDNNDWIGVVYPEDEYRLPLGVTYEIVTKWDGNRTARLVEGPLLDMRKYPIEQYRWRPENGISVLKP